MEVFSCPTGCCTICITPYNAVTNRFEKVRRQKRKAGALIYDRETDKMLIVQSRGQLWGCPKGTLESKESDRDCAVREIKEETGLDVDINESAPMIRIRDRATYYYIEMVECDVSVQSHVPDNDANGIAWITLDCLAACIDNGNISVTQHCRIALQHFLQKRLPHSTFITVGNTTRSSRF